MFHVRTANARRFPLFETRRAAVSAAIAAAVADSPGGEASVYEQPAPGHPNHPEVFRNEWVKIACYRSTPRGYRKVSVGAI